MAILPFPPDSPEDIAQEAAARALEGGAGPRSRTPREYGYGLVPAEGTLLLDEAFTVNFAALEAIISWSLSQQARVRLAVVEYLDDPDDQHLGAVLSLLDVEVPASRVQKEVSLTTLILHGLPATLEQLYELARRNHRSRRPEAAVRQTIRNLKRRGLVTINEREQVCPVASPVS